MIPQNKQGFTLLELLLVLVIIGIILKFAFLSYGDFGTKRKVTQLAQQVIAELTTMQLQAELEGIPITIKLNPQGYTVLRDKNILHKYFFPHNMRAACTNNIMILANGTIGKFSCVFGTNFTPKMIQLTDNLLIKQVDNAH